jgi:hypothetical protein
MARAAGGAAPVSERYRVTVRGEDMELRGIVNGYPTLTQLASALNYPSGPLVIGSELTPPALAAHEEATGGPDGE